MLDLLISSGVGPDEASRFALLLARRLEALAVIRGFDVREVVSHPRSVVLRLCGDATALIDELGTHVLVHRSSARSRSSRKRWFAAVSLHDAPPELADADPISRDDLVITACRAGGPGGQHVNKVSSAVRIHHVPSNISIRSTVARSQKANLDHALRRLAQLLRERTLAAHARTARSHRDAHYRVERGRPIRTYHLADGVLVERTP